MLLCFPAHELARLLFLDALGLNLLDHHVAPADGGDDVLGADAGIIECGTDRIGHDAGIHHFAFDDCVGLKLCNRDFHQLGCSLAVIDYRDLDEARSNIETDCRFPAAEERHDYPGVGDFS